MDRPRSASKTLRAGGGAPKASRRHVDRSLRNERIDGSDLRPLPGSIRIAARPRSAPTRILMAFLTRIYSEAIERVLTSVPGFEIVGSVATAPEILVSVRRLSPHVLLMDLTAQLMPRLATAATVVKTQPGVGVVGILPALRERHAEMLLRSGISGLLGRDAGVSEVARAIVEVAAGRLYLSQCYGEALRVVFPRPGVRSVANSRDSLSAREEEVLHHVTRGFTSREIGNRLFISSRTVENHIAELYRKLHVRDNHQLSCEIYQDEEADLAFGEE
jgi:DNA-binding NarL/FixJ family response regulator